MGYLICAFDFVVVFFFTQLENGVFLCRLLASKLSKSRGPRLLLFYPRPRRAVTTKLCACQMPRA